MIRLLLPLASAALLAQTPVPPPAHPAPAPAPAPAQALPAKPHPVMMPPAPAAAPEPKDTDVLATLGPKTITYGDFKKWLKIMAGPRAGMITANPSSRTQVQNQFLDMQVLAAKGRKEHLQATPEFKELIAALQDQAYARLIMDDSRPGGEMQKLKETAENPSDPEVQAFFEANADRWATPAKFSARHILVSLHPVGGKARTEEEAKERVAKVQEELKAGKKLEDLAKEYSDDPGSRDKGGLYTDIAYGRFAKEFEEAVQKQEVGQVGEPVKTTFGYHLIEVVSRTPKQPAEFEKVKDTVKRQLVAERREKMSKDFMEQAKKEVDFHGGPGAPAKPAAPAKRAHPKK